IDKFHQDTETKAIVMIGQMGGMFEEATADYYKTIKNPKPIIAFVAGSVIPFGHNMGYAGDIMTGGQVSAQDKKDALSDAGIIVVDNINDIHLRLQEL
ncbi:MAG: succinate--CoA ligase subunit alpha, partial [Alphaproteobacteria bacterium]|nr:succinate--CoA ligase subunit alpha [Alphaproteobacteria bacterium]